MMFALWLLIGTLIAPNLVFGAIDPYCNNNCKCCEDERCHTGILNWPNVCTSGCIDGHRGYRCYEFCKYANCKSCGFNTDSKTCSACYDGYYLGTNEDCTLQCPVNCRSCTSSTHCTRCKKGYYDKNGSTTCKYALCPENCECSATKCITCKIGFYDASTNCSSTCPINCDTCVSKDKCVDCKTGFYNGYEYDNNKGLQLNNCTYNCRDTCLTCQPYNNCSKCVNGKHGLTCHKDCSVGCKENTCLIESGNCDNCAKKFQGDKCDACMAGYFGQNCNDICPPQCSMNICDRSTGACVNGCMKGYSGDRCCTESENCNKCYSNKECRKCNSGYFQHMCKARCPIDCRDSCEFSTGVCDDCQNNSFGAFCNYRCSDTCHIPQEISGTQCARSDGSCMYGCDDGYFGLTCNKTCSSLCVGKTCMQDSGVCVQGCDDQHKVPECVITLATKDDGNGDIPTFAAVLGSMFALSVCINVVAVIFLVQQRRKTSRYEARRQPRDVTYENQLVSQDESTVESEASITDGKTNAESSKKSTVYELINRANEVEQDYQQISSMTASHY